MNINTGNLFHATSLTSKHVDHLILHSHVLQHASVTGTVILFLSQALGVRVRLEEFQLVYSNYCSSLVTLYISFVIYNAAIGIEYKIHQQFCRSYELVQFFSHPLL